MTDLSPAAQAILDAAKLPSKCYARSIAAAILRAAADQMLLMRPHEGPPWHIVPATSYDAITKMADFQVSIADELDGQ